MKLQFDANQEYQLEAIKAAGVRVNRMIDAVSRTERCFFSIFSSAVFSYCVYRDKTPNVKLGANQKSKTSPCRRRLNTVYDSRHIIKDELYHKQVGKAREILNKELVPSIVGG